MSTLSVMLETPRGRVAILACRVLVAVVFVWAGLPKLLDAATFAEDISNYRLVPEALVGVLAVAVPVLELTVAAALLSGIEARGAAVVAGMLLLGFTAGMLQAMARGIDLSCGCFGAATDAKVGWPSVGRNVALVLASAIVVVAPHVPWRARSGDGTAKDRSAP